MLFIGTGIKLLFGGLGWIKDAAVSLWEWITASAARMLGVALVVALLAFVWAYRGKTNALDERDIARAETKAQAASYRAAQVEAETAQIAANKATEAATARTARKADHDYQIALDGARSAASRYADANRVRGETACRPARAASAAAQAGPAPNRNGPGDGPNMVAVTRDDFTALTDNTIRLQAVHDWADALIREGRALPEVGY